MDKIQISALVKTVTREKLMEMLMIVKFTKVNFDEWLAVFEADGKMRSKLMKDDIVGKIDDHTAMVKTTIFNQEGLASAMAIRIPELVEQMGLTNEMFVLKLAG